MLLNPNNPQTSQQSQPYPNQTDPSAIPEDKRKADWERLQQALSIKTSKHREEATILKSAPKQNSGGGLGVIANPFRDDPQVTSPSTT